MLEKCKQFRNSVKISFGRCLLSEIKSDLISCRSEVKGGVSWGDDMSDTTDKKRMHRPKMPIEKSEAPDAVVASTIAEIYQCTARRDYEAGIPVT